MNREEVTNNIKVPNKDLEILRENFPHCFDKHGNFQLEKFKTILSEKEINFSNESYSLDWLGKSYARLLASEPANTLLPQNPKTPVGCFVKKFRKLLRLHTFEN